MMTVAQSCPTLRPHGLYSPWNSPGQNTGVGSLSLLQGIFPTQGSNPGLPHCRRNLYQLSHKGSWRILEWVADPFSCGSSLPRNRTRISCIAGGFFANWAMREALINLILASNKADVPRAQETSTAWWWWHWSFKSDSGLLNLCIELLPCISFHSGIFADYSNICAGVLRTWALALKTRIRRLALPLSCVTLLFFLLLGPCVPGVTWSYSRIATSSERGRRVT